MDAELKTNVATPVADQNRIVILDSLRGIAILGILLMNIPGFGLPSPAAYGDLSVLNEMGTINFHSWYYLELSVSGTQRALFSILFGAGMILFLTNKQKKVDGMLAAEYFFRRQLWLLVFGLINAFVLLWFWDILFHYACCGMILFAFRRVSVKGLIIAAVVCLVFQTMRDNTLFYRNKNMIAKGEMIAKIDTTVTKLNDDQQAALGAMKEFKEKNTPEGKKKEMEKSLRKVRGDYNSFYEYQSERSFYGEVHYLYDGLWDILIFMFLGMAFFKSGVLIGEAPVKLYWMLFIGGMSIGVLITWYNLQQYINLNFNNYEIIKQVKFELYQVARTFKSIGIFGLIMLLYKSGIFKWLFNLMRPVGQMAFTNYLMQSLLVGLFFYGIGFGMFGKLQRFELYYVVAATWALQIIYSHIWLHFFRFGPLEWAWRCLTYWQIQPFRRSKQNKN